MDNTEVLFVPQGKLCYILWPDILSQLFHTVLPNVYEYLR